MKRILRIAVFALTALCGGLHDAVAQDVPAPLYRDPITDGAADPCLVYNPFEKAWWMLYTQRRANADFQLSSGTTTGSATALICSASLTVIKTWR